MTTRRAETGIISPVFGLRPGLLFLLRRQNTPKPDSFTVSPRSSSVEISSKNAITISAASRLFTPRFSCSRVARSALVIVIRPSIYDHDQVHFLERDGVRQARMRIASASHAHRYFGA